MSVHESIELVRDYLKDHRQCRSLYRGDTLETSELQKHLDAIWAVQNPRCLCIDFW